MTFWEQGISFFVKGGFMMYPILLASIITGSIAIERFVVYRKAGKDTILLWGQIKEYLVAGNVSKAKQLCSGEANVIVPVILKGIGLYESKQRGISREAMEGAAAAQITFLRARLSYLSTIVTVAPLLGLLGTVFGMIRTFDVVAIASGQSTVITGGVGEALIATSAGLIVAIVALMVYSFFNEWLNHIISDMETVANDFLETIEGEAGV
jgi:biopolymer transport protein ExbB